MTPEFYQLIVDAGRQGRALWMATIVRSEGSGPAAPGMKMLVGTEGRIAGTIGGGDIEHQVIARIIGQCPRSATLWRYDLGTGAEGDPTSMICGGVQEVFVEPLWNAPPLIIVGGGHVGMALSALAAHTGFAVTVVDDRAEWADPARHPSAIRCVCTPYPGIRGQLVFNDETSIVIMTHGHRHDELVLRLLLDVPHRYLGMIGSATKVRALFDRLAGEGIDPEALQRVYSPIGFDIGSHTPDEIAVSIAAQLIAVKNGRNPGRMG